MQNNKLSDVNSKSGSELIAIAHGIAANFESPATELLRELASRLECSIIRGNELQQKLDAMAVENAELKVIVECVNSELYGKGFEVSGWHLNGSLEPLDNWFTDNAWGLPETPATDAHMNSVRAEGVEMFGDFAGQQYQLHEGDKAQQKKWKSVVFLCCQYAAQLRSGTHDTADKAG
ncbi:hypothetical protein [Pantoea ananatis]|uniref:hypothetical protein n=1 Tax=Pantoea ananas TaxID=553 RepID=UPI001B30A15C|nr:hypothetical protein [Pantoea ananatis]